MGFLDRLRGRGDDDATAPAEDAEGAGDAGRFGDAGTAGSGAVEGVEPLEEIGVRRLSPEEEAVLEEARAGYAAHGIDPADLSTIAAAYDRAVDRVGDSGDATSDVVAVLGTAIGDHLVAVAGYRWVMSTDPFGTDLAVEPPRRGVPVVTRMLVAVRWMARERGWVAGVTGHLADVGRR